MIVPSQVIRVTAGKYAGGIGRVRRVEPNGLAFVTATGYPRGWLISVDLLKPVSVARRPDSVDSQERVR